MKPHNLRHALLHVTKYVGEAANIIEKLDHPEELGAALEMMERFVSRRPKHMKVSFDALVEYMVQELEDLHDELNE